MLIFGGYGAFSISVCSQLSYKCLSNFEQLETPRQDYKNRSYELEVYNAYQYTMAFLNIQAQNIFTTKNKKDLTQSAYF